MRLSGGGSYATADGDAETWVSTWAALSGTVRAQAGKCAAEGRAVSARDAFLRAAGYFGTALVAVDGCADPEARLGELFTEHRDCFDRFAAAWDPPAERVAIPYEGISLAGLPRQPAGPFRSTADGEQRVFDWLDARLDSGPRARG
ncbi:hypothetical protein RB199_09885 [Streptomyces libani]|uniref:hypothetical protein n=1 Tax=Streptomyces nigrescens TaxID=1920 RepID=UPI00303E2CF1